MIYLFHKVYLKLDVGFGYSRRYKNSILITPHATHLTSANDDLQSINAIDFGTAHFAETSLEALLTNHFDDDINKFFVWLWNFDSTQRLTISCSPDVLETLMYVWLKTVFPQMDGDEAYQLLRTYYFRFRYQWGYPYAPFVKLSVEDAQAYKAFGQRLPSIDDVKARWAATKPIEGLDRDLLTQTAGIEFQIATYLNNKNWKHKDVLAATAKMMFLKVQIRLFLDVKQDTLSRLYSLPDFDILNDTLLEYIVKHPEYVFLLDNNILPDNYEHVFATYDMTKLRPVAIQLIDLWYNHVDEKLLQDIHWLDPNVTLDDILNVEMAAAFHRRFLGTWDYANQLNPLLLEYIFQLHQTNNPALAKYSLEV